MLATAAFLTGCDPQTTPARREDLPAAAAHRRPGVLLFAHGGGLAANDRWVVVLDDGELIGSQETGMVFVTLDEWVASLELRQARLERTELGALQRALAVPELAAARDVYVEDGICDGGYLSVATAAGHRELTLVNRPGDMPPAVAELMTRTNTALQRLDRGKPAVDAPSRLRLVHRRQLEGGLRDELLAFADGRVLYVLHSPHRFTAGYGVAQVRYLDGTRQAALEGALGASLPPSSRDFDGDNEVHHEVVLASRRYAYRSKPPQPVAALAELALRWRSEFPAAVEAPR
jgi:hypothetical protein